ncbi:scavenger receptor cysteine-rich type 1 protein M130-like [Eucyclogobius newberryi]|uniref:scavenger receptor cysteine-rich type 1 protein M130-like n=1 Tax=Eucyclogobius newberryi TaxID=166745 RepID=UPI003B5A34C7
MKQHLLLLICALPLMSSAKETASSGVIDARLVNGDTRCSGHLEMKHQGQWRTLKVRSNRESSRVGFAELACRQTGCGSAVSVQFHRNVTEPKPAWEVYFSCKGTDQTIRQCKETASRQKVDDVESCVSSRRVACSETLRISSDHASSCSGTVMVKSDQD